MSWKSVFAMLASAGGLAAAPAFAEGPAPDDTALARLVRNWADEVAKSKGTHVAWVDLHARRPEMQQYQFAKVSGVPRNCRYENLVAIDQPPQTFDFETQNPTGEKVLNKTGKSVMTNHQYSWTMKNALEDSSETNVNANLGFAPAMDKGGPSASVGLSFTQKHSVNLASEQTQSDSEQVSWEAASEIPVSPYTLQKGKIQIDMKRFSASFVCDVVYRGQAAVWFDSKINLDGSGDHWLWFPTLAEVVQARPGQGFTVQGDQVLATVQGDFEGIQGVKMHTKLEKPVSLDDGSAPAASRPRPLSKASASPGQDSRTEEGSDLESESVANLDSESGESN